MLKSLGVENVEFNTYPDLGHSADPAEIDDLEKFLMKALPMESDAAAGL
jgi:predicted esterase